MYRIEMVTKANQNKDVKPTTSLLHDEQSMNKTERHGHTETLYQIPCLQGYP